MTIKANEIGRTTTVIDGVTYNIVCDEPAAVNDKATLSTDAQVAERTYLEKDYPEGTFAKSGIAEAIAKAKEVAQKEKVTKLEIKEADDALKKALGKLDEVKASGKTEVQTKIAQAAEKKEADYTKESWANFAKAKRMQKWHLLLKQQPQTAERCCRCIRHRHESTGSKETG